MERITISLEPELADGFHHLIARRGYRNRSEAVRDLIRRELGELRLGEAPQQSCVGSLTYVFNHHERSLAARLTETQHRHHDLALSTTHVHLDHDHCLETVILRGPAEQVQRFAETVMAEPGVRHGRLHLVPVDEHREQHAPGGHGGQRHSHYRPLP